MQKSVFQTIEPKDIFFFTADMPRFMDGNGVAPHALLPSRDRSNAEFKTGETVEKFRNVNLKRS